VRPQCVGDPKICVHGCTLVIQILAHGGALRGGKGVHVMRTYWLHSCAWVRGCVVVRRVVMCACVRDKCTWRRLYLVDRHAFMHTYGMNRHALMHTYGMNRRACMHVCGVNRHTYVRACGFKQTHLGGKVDG
jgi:hypothetical protein